MQPEEENGACCERKRRKFLSSLLFLIHLSPQTPREPLSTAIQNQNWTFCLKSHSLIKIGINSGEFMAGLKLKLLLAPLLTDLLHVEPQD